MTQRRSHWRPRLVLLAVIKRTGTPENPEAYISVIARNLVKDLARRGPGSLLLYSLTNLSSRLDRIRRGREAMTFPVWVASTSFHDASGRCSKACMEKIRTYEQLPGGWGSARPRPKSIGSEA